MSLTAHDYAGMGSTAIRGRSVFDAPYGPAPTAHRGIYRTGLEPVLQALAWRNHAIAKELLHRFLNGEFPMAAITPFEPEANSLFQTAVETAIREHAELGLQVAVYHQDALEVRMARAAWL